MVSEAREISFKTPGYTQVPNAILDNMGDLKKAELRVLLAAIRITIGFHKTKARLSLTKMQRVTGLSRQSILNASEDLIGRGLLIKRQDGGVTIWEIGFADKMKQITLLDPDKPKEKPEEKPLPDSGNIYKMAKVICAATNSDWDLQRGRIFKTAKDLQKSRYTYDDVVAVFGNSGYWFTLDWRGKQGSNPTLGQVKSEIRGLLDKGAEAEARAGGKPQVNPDGSLGG